MKKLVDGVLVNMTAQEQAEHATPTEALAQPAPPTKEQLMAELAALTAKIQALE